MPLDEELFTRQLPTDRFREQTDPVLQLEEINVNFDGFQALTNLSLQIGVGELRCVIGPNGAGKTTLMDVITGKTRPQSGRALYDQSVDLTTLDPIAIARQGIGRKFQKPTVFEALTVAENLELAMKGDKSVWASLRARLNSEQADRISETLRLLRLDAEGQLGGALKIAALIAAAALLGELEQAQGAPRQALRSLAEGLKVAELTGESADPHLLAVLAHVQAVRRTVLSWGALAGICAGTFYVVGFNVPSWCWWSRTI